MMKIWKLWNNSVKRFEVEKEHQGHSKKSMEKNATSAQCS